ncbi:hypothetical protein Trydic_g2015 [Trypoxylus dichotomus]
MAEEEKPRKFTQIIGAIAATMGGLTLGTTIGWSSPAQDILIEGGVTQQQYPHISSIMCLGAATAQLYLFFTIDRLGRRWTMIIMACPIIACYALMGVINNWIVFLIARFWLGFCGGAFCVAAPTYIGEFADKHIRGTLGVMFQLLLVIGIEISYILGLAQNRLVLCFPLVAPPAICIIMMVFLPESPVLLKMKNKDAQMKKALKFYRGKDFNTTQDEKDIMDYIKSGEGTFKENMKKKSTINGFLILLVLHIVQQLGGINAVMFYAGNIFKSGNFFGLSSDACVVVLGATQIVSVGIATGLVDRVGRRILWLVSLGLMAVCLIITGVYFIIKSQDNETRTGPLPWSMIGELLSAGAKTYTGPIITAVNWILAYLVTVSYPYLDKSVGPGPVFLGYGVICILGFVFVLFFLVETKGRTLDEIQKALGEKPREAPGRKAASSSGAT